ncbi:MAG: hypothetical protein J7K36_11085 [Archaeoglobaceae archaeon]|nr:hypothetical protein [Archaeoglobaceae archaeon]
MSRTPLLICLAIIFVAVAVSAYTQLSHLIHIEINPSENETEVWKENTSKAPVPAAQLYPQPGKTILKKLFGKEDPKNLTLLDGIMKVFEMPEGKAKIQELIGSWNVIVFQGLAFIIIKSESSDYRFEIVEGRGISANNDVYVFGFIENCTEREAPYIKMINGWNLTLDEDLWISNVLKCFDGTIYAAGVDIAKMAGLDG